MKVVDPRIKEKIRKETRESFKEKYDAAKLS
jgi:hypothetical protein